MKTQPSSNGVVVAPLGARFGAALVDRLGPALIGGCWSWLFFRLAADGWLIYTVAAVLLLFAWMMVQWWAYATRRAGLGYRVFRLELVGLADGKPIGWGRMCLRTLISYALWSLLLPGIAMVIFLVIQERRQGWPDLAVGSLAIARRQPTAVVSEPIGVSAAGRRSSNTVSLPPHLLTNTFAAQPELPQSAPIDRVPLAEPGGYGQSAAASARFAPPDPQPAQPSPMAQPPATSYQPPYQPPQLQQPAAQQPPQPQQPPAQQGAFPAQQPPQPVVQAPPGVHPQPGLAPPVQPSQPQQAAVQQAGFQAQPPTSVQPQQPGPQHAVPGGPAFSPPVGSPPPAQLGPAQPGPQVPLPPTQPYRPAQPSPQYQADQPSPGPRPAASPAQPPLRIKPREVPNDDIDGTRLVTSPGRTVRPANEGWCVRLDDGREIPVTGVVLIGRSPVARADERGATLVPAGEPGRTVSKTHLALGVDERGIYVVDRGSTNGTAVLNVKGELEPCPANAQMRLRDGQVVSFGERQLRVRRLRKTEE